MEGLLFILAGSNAAGVRIVVTRREGRKRKDYVTQVPTI